MKWAEFLVSVPPGNTEKITELGEIHSPDKSKLYVPSIYLDCTSKICDDIRIFDGRSSYNVFEHNNWQDGYLYYNCRHCRQVTKAFAIRLRFTSSSGGEALKFGEWPQFGTRIPARVITLIGPDRELFLKAKRAEDQGMGIGAFGYYRRVVENQKDRLIDEIIRVSRHIEASEELIKRLEAAKEETQFSRAIEIIKDGIPEILRIKGHNPLTLLHTSLSQGLHSDSDEDCLELAKSIRVVLMGLAERIEQAMKDEAEINQAVNRLLRSGEKKKDGDKQPSNQKKSG